MQSRIPTLERITMIGNLTIKHLTPDTYTALIQGNGGEEEAVLSASPGQDGRVRVIFTGMSVDGGASVLYQGAVSSKTLGIKLRVILLAWASAGIPPTKIEAQGLSEVIDSIVHQVLTMWGAMRA
jgi:hypothetical protein